MGNEKKGFIEKIKDFFAKLKEENKGFGAAMARMNNAKEFCGEVNRGVKNGDFWEGSYLNLSGDDAAVIYGSSQEDYFITKETVVSFKQLTKPTRKTVGGKEHLSARYELTFTDGKIASVDFIEDQWSIFIKNLDIKDFEIK